MRKFLILVVILLLSVAAVWAQSAWAAEDHSWYGTLPGSITVDNCTKEKLYVLIDDRNQGPVDPNYDATFCVPYGDRKVLVQGYEKTASTYLRVSRFSPTNSWVVSEADLR